MKRNHRCDKEMRRSKAGMMMRDATRGLLLYQVHTYRIFARTYWYCTVLYQGTSSLRTRTSSDGHNNATWFLPGFHWNALQHPTLVQHTPSLSLSSSFELLFSFHHYKSTTTKEIISLNILINTKPCPSSHHPCS
jgi:hypothetical protein